MEYKSPEWWEARGRTDYGARVPRLASPDGGKGTIEGDAWRKGWDTAEADYVTDNGDDEVFEVAPVHVAAVGGRLRLCDHKGRVLGPQTSVLLEQTEDGRVAITVTFADVALKLG